MKSTSFKRSVLGAALFLAASGTQAVTLLTDVSGRLTGATGVDISGTSYDVAFRDTTCLAAFGTCDLSTVFAFPTQASAHDALQALMSQVITGVFDSQPNKVIGCDDPSYCLILTPYKVSLNAANQLQVSTKGVGNSATEAADIVLPLSVDIVMNPDTDLSVGNPIFTYAVWSRTPAEPPVEPPVDTAMPEPGAMALAGLGMVALWGSRRR